ncbi:unnamed protein product [Protopolystoma xenopodis]|uniref:Uncharacterized protein n=1 Tax=Protopolystoma xenopodis TaxID=117903 RepID=A0A448WEL5_9PLAT|nr:unnamed protein product [Protopolystoma xenopodis]
MAKHPSNTGRTGVIWITLDGQSGEGLRCCVYYFAASRSEASRTIWQRIRLSSLDTDFLTMPSDK